jgi:hypothetical protein
MEDDAWEPFPDNCFCISQLQCGMTIIIDCVQYVYLCSTTAFIFAQVIDQHTKDYVMKFPIDCGWIPIMGEFDHNIRARCQSAIFTVLHDVTEIEEGSTMVVLGSSHHYQYVSRSINGTITYKEGNFLHKIQWKPNSFWYLNDSTKYLYNF